MHKRLANYKSTIDLNSNNTVLIIEIPQSFKDLIYVDYHDSVILLPEFYLDITYKEVNNEETNDLINMSSNYKNINNIYCSLIEISESGSTTPEGQFRPKTPDMPYDRPGTPDWDEDYEEDEEDTHSDQEKANDDQPSTDVKTSDDQKGNKDLKIKIDIKSKED